MGRGIRFKYAIAPIFGLVLGEGNALYARPAQPFPLSTQRTRKPAEFPFEQLVNKWKTLWEDFRSSAEWQEVSYLKVSLNDVSIRSTEDSARESDSGYLALYDDNYKAIFVAQKQLDLLDLHLSAAFDLHQRLDIIALETFPTIVHELTHADLAKKVTEKWDDADFYDLGGGLIDELRATVTQALATQLTEPKRVSPRPSRSLANTTAQATVMTRTTLKSISTQWTLIAQK